MAFKKFIFKICNSFAFNECNQLSTKKDICVCIPSICDVMSHYFASLQSKDAKVFKTIFFVMK